MIKKLPLLVLVLSVIACYQEATAAPVTYNTGDIFIGFETTGATGAGINLLVDIGNNYADPVSGSINLEADLAAKYGPGWYTNGSVYYGVFGIKGTGSAYNGVIASTPAGTTGLPNRNSGAAATMISDYGALGAQYNVDKNNNQTLTTAVYQNNSTENQGGTWSYYNPSTQPFGTYNKSIETLVSSNLDIYSMTTANTGLGSKIESITINNLGILSIVAVPEPASCALSVLGAGAIVLAIRRRKSA